MMIYKYLFHQILYICKYICNSLPIILQLLIIKYIQEFLLGFKTIFQLFKFGTKLISTSFYRFLFCLSRCLFIRPIWDLFLGSVTENFSESQLPLPRQFCDLESNRVGIQSFTRLFRLMGSTMSKNKI